MKLQEQIKKDLTLAIKSKAEKQKDALRVILGEMGRLEKKEFSDDEVVKILKKLLKAEKEVLEKKGEKEDSEFVRVVERYLPKMAGETEIRSWIEQHIDFSQFKSKMQAMGPIMKHFGSTAEGDTVKKILEQM